MRVAILKSHSERTNIKGSKIVIFKTPISKAKLNQAVHSNSLQHYIIESNPDIKPNLYFHLINNPRMFNGVLFDLAEKPYIPQKILLQ